MTALNSRRLNPPLVAAMIGLGLLALSPLVQLCWQHAANAYWAAQIEALPEADAVDLIRRLPDRDSSIAVLTRALVSTKSNVALAACDALLGRIASWNAGEASTTKSVGLLARALRDVVDDGDGSCSVAAGEVAFAILNWQQARGQTDLQLLEDCQQVLSAVNRRPGKRGVPVDRGLALSSAPPLPLDVELPPGHDWREVPTLAQLPSDAPKSGDSAQDSDREAGTDVLEEEPALLQSPEEVRSLVSGSQGTLQVGRTDREAGSAAKLQGNHFLRLVSDVSNDSDTDPLIEALHRMRSAGDTAAASIQDQLAEYKLTDVELALCGELLISGADRRRRLAETLPGLATIDAKRWLKLLAYDESAEVRLTALTLLATTGDPALVAFARQRATRDADERVRSQLGRQISPDASR